MEIPYWFPNVAIRELGESLAKLLLEQIAQIDESIMDRQDPERIAAAILILARRSPGNIPNIVRAAETDWRDLLMGAGLAGNDWRQQLNEVVESGT